MGLTNKEIKSMSYEESVERMEAIVKRLEQGNVPLEQAVQEYTDGMALKAHCEKQLKDATLKVEKITTGEG